MTEVLAIIPARGGSKGIPRKNVLPLAGKPLIAHCIEAALAAYSVTRVVVSTDDPEIASVARRYRAEVVDRPVELATDLAKSEDALLHVLTELQSSEGYRPEIVAFLQCTSPLTVPDDIDGAIAEVLNGNADTAVAVTDFHYFIWKTDENGDGVGVNHHKLVRPMRQQREPEFLETGSVYAMRTDGFLNARHRFFGKTALYRIPSERVLEIDDPYDFVRAEERIRASRRTVDAFAQATIRALAMDFDGVHTDDTVIVDEDGRESASCNRRDGMGIENLRKAGIPMIVITKERISIAARRCEKLGIPCLDGEDDKLPKLERWAEEIGVPMSEIAYIGNDTNDVACLRAAGLGVTPADAHPEALAAADVVLAHGGGRGALRELADRLLEGRIQP